MDAGIHIKKRMTVYTAASIQTSNIIYWLVYIRRIKGDRYFTVLRRKDRSGLIARFKIKIR